MNPPVLGVCVASGLIAATFLVKRARSESRNSKLRGRLVSVSDSQFVLPSFRLTGRQNILVLAGVCAIGGFLVGGAGLGIICAAAVAMAAHFAKVRSDRMFIKKYESQIPLVLDALIMSVKSGASLPVAMNEVAKDLKGPVVPDLREVVRHLELGFGLNDSLKVWSQRCTLDSVRVTVAALTLAHESGLSIASSLGSVRETVGFALSRADSARTAAAQAQASTMALAGLPAMVSGPMLVFNNSARAFMFHTFPGVGILVVGLSLDVCGLIWMNRLIERTQR